MHSDYFSSTEPHVADNQRLRTPQREAYTELSAFAASGTGREASVILPVGCGKSGCIALAPFAFKAHRALVVAPNVKIAQQLHQDFNPSFTDMFYKKCGVITDQGFPESAEIRGRTSNQSDLDIADVIVTNIQQLHTRERSALTELPNDYFDLILFDEAHHNVADSWTTLTDAFPDARIVNFTATPRRADGKVMSGEVVYSYPVASAIHEGYVKRLKAVALNPSTLTYVRREGDKEVSVDLDEVRRMGESDANFRRSIVTSRETLATIADASIHQLRALRERADDNRIKIIASALNHRHCAEVVEAYSARGLRAAYVHSKEDSTRNKRVLDDLENHDLDVIVQVRQLGEGFDHPYLGVAAVFSLFANLSPFVQFVGRIMRVIKQNAPGDPLNQGVVVFHSGANIIGRWEDFQEFSEADQEYFKELMPLEEQFGFQPSLEIEGKPVKTQPTPNEIDVRTQTDVRQEELPLLHDDPEVEKAMKLLFEKGVDQDMIASQFDQLERIQAPAQERRRAKRKKLDESIKIETADLLRRHNVNGEGHHLDKQYLGRTNFQVVKATIDKRVDAIVDRQVGQRHSFSLAELENAEDNLQDIVAEVEGVLFDASN